MFKFNLKLSYLLSILYLFGTFSGISGVVSTVSQNITPNQIPYFTDNKTLTNSAATLDGAGNLDLKGGGLKANGAIITNAAIYDPAGNVVAYSYITSIITNQLPNTNIYYFSGSGLSTPYTFPFLWSGTGTGPKAFGYTNTVGTMGFWPVPSQNFFASGADTNAAANTTDYDNDSVSPVPNTLQPTNWLSLNNSDWEQDAGTGPANMTGTFGTNLVVITNWATVFTNVTLPSPTITITNGVTNFQTTVSFGGIKGVELPLIFYGFSDSLFQNSRTDGWKSQGGFTNQYSTGGVTNGYIFYNIGSYSTNNVSVMNAMSNSAYANNNLFFNIDIAGVVPGGLGIDLWGTFNGSNYISMTSLQANLNFDQVHGFTYTSSGLFTNNNAIHGDPLPQTWWPASTNDISLTIQGNTYTNLLTNQPISLTITGNSYNVGIFKGTPSFTTATLVSSAWKAGQGSIAKYAAPYTSASDGLNFSGGNLPTGTWGDSNAPVRTGAKAGIMIQFGNNDTAKTTNDQALFAVLCSYADHEHAMGYWPIILWSGSLSPSFVGNSRLLTMTNLINDERAGWQGHFDAFVDVQKMMDFNNMWQNSIFFMADGTHWQWYTANYIATNGLAQLQWANLIPTAPVPSYSGNHFGNGGGLTNLPPYTTFTTNFTSAVTGSNIWNRPILLTPNVVYSEASVAGTSQLQVEVPGFMTNYTVPLFTIIGSSGNFRGTMAPVIVPSGRVWFIRDISTGAGVSCNPTNGTIQIQ